MEVLTEEVVTMLIMESENCGYETATGLAFGHDQPLNTFYPKKSLNQKLTPKKTHAEFPSLTNFQKALNDITRKLKTLEIECLCLFIHHTTEVIFSASGSHSSNTRDTQDTQH